MTDAIPIKGGSGESACSVHFSTRTGRQSMSKSKDVSRRAILAGAAAVPATAAVAAAALAAAEPDPIFAAIEAQRRCMRCFQRELQPAR
jgi:hypothetical protein